MIITGLVEFLIGADVKAQSADYHMQAESALTGFALVFLLLRGFSSGSAALTGVEAISNGVPAFKKPKSRNAATTLALMAALSVSMMLGLVALTLYTGVQFADDPATPADRRAGGLLPEDADRADRRDGVLRLPARPSTSCRSPPA